MNSPFLWLLSPGRQKKLRINLSYKIPTWNQILPLTEMLQIQNVWDTLSLRKQFLEAELNVREFLGIQGITTRPPPPTWQKCCPIALAQYSNISMGKQYFCRDKVKFVIYVSWKGEEGLQDYSRLVNLNNTLMKGAQSKLFFQGLNKISWARAAWITQCLINIFFTK